MAGFSSTAVAAPKRNEKREKKDEQEMAFDLILL